jgi:hypothetical protein
MRRLSESWPNATVSASVDGLRLVTDGAEVYVAPDSLEPQIHLFAESDSLPVCEKAVFTVSETIRTMLAT